MRTGGEITIDNWNGMRSPINCGRGNQVSAIVVLLISVPIILLMLPCILACLRSENSAPDVDEIPFEEQFPPRSDAEFVERCGPGTNAAVALKVRRLLSDCLGVDYERIHPSARIVQDLGAY